MDESSSDAGGGEVSTNDPRIGTRIGGYEIESFLGRGGMGVVYRARHTRLGRLVALKVLVPELAADETFRTRFVRESQMAASIDHPNVIPVYDADEIDGVLYLAMRFVEGTDLKKMIVGGGALDPLASVSVVGQIAGALDAAHARGLIHRDVKPANVLVSDTGDGGYHIYLTDFGLTKHSSSKSGITATGAFIGTIDYIAPEQIEGNPVDARTDVYALGCVLYECLTGEVPFTKDADVAVMYAHMMDPRPKATDRKPELPAEIDAVLARAMARQPEERYPSAGALAADLRAVLDPGSVPVSGGGTARPHPAVPARSRRSLRSRSLVVAGLVAVAGAAGAWWLTREEASEKAAQRSPSGSTGVVDAVFVSPDGAADASGTRPDPIASLDAALKQAGAGGTVILMDGTYEADSVPMLEVRKPVTLVADEGASPVLLGDLDHPDGIYVAPGLTGVTVSGITFDNFDGEALKFFCSDCGTDPENVNITLEDLVFTGGGSPMIFESAAGLVVTRVKVEENFHNGLLCSPGPCSDVTITDSSFLSSSQPRTAGVLIESGDGVYIETSDASFNNGAGFVSHATGTQIVRSRATNNVGVGVTLGGADSEIRDSIVAVNREAGMSLGTATCPDCRPQGTLKVANVLIVDNGVGILADASRGKVAFQMFNSILTDNGGTALDIAGSVRVTRLDFNLFDTAGAVAVTYRGADYSENKLGRSAFPGDVDAGTYSSSPTFEGPGDYHLAADSSGVNGGTQEGVMSQVDIDGNPRVSGEEIDMGPYERS